MRLKTILCPMLGVSAIVPATTRAVEQPDKPNVIFVFADQWRKQALGYRSEDPVRTPNLDRFASWACSFDNATSTSPVSGPNRACLLTGKYTVNTGVFANNVPLDPGEKTLGDLCKQAGYATAYIGKWHLNGQEDYVADKSRRHGFDVWIQSVGHTPFNQKYYIGEDTKPIYKKDVWSPTYETDEAIKFIDSNKGNPFCVVLSYNPPHTSGGYMFEDRYQPGIHNPDGSVKYGYGYGGPRAFEALYRDNDYLKNPIRGNVRPMVKSKYKDESAGCVAGWFGSITAIDNDFGNLVDYLEKNDLLGNTIIVFTADHGESMGSHGLMTKGTWFEESLGIPAIIGWRGKIKPAREKSVFNSIDYVPTLMSLMGIETPADIDGTDYSPLLLGQPFVAPRYSFQTFNFGGVAEARARYWRSVYTDRYTLVLCGKNVNRDFTKDGLALYDRQSDPLQLRPIGKGMGYDKVIDELYDVLSKHLDKIGDPFITEYWHNPDPGYPKMNKYTMDLDEYKKNLTAGPGRKK